MDLYYQLSESIIFNQSIFDYNRSLTEHYQAYSKRILKWLVWFMVFNATFNNISVITWRSVLLVEETGVPRENHRPVASH